MRKAYYNYNRKCGESEVNTMKDYIVQKLVSIVLKGDWTKPDAIKFVRNENGFTSNAEICKQYIPENDTTFISMCEKQ